MADINDINDIITRVISYYDKKTELEFGYIELPSLPLDMLQALIGIEFQRLSAQPNKSK